MTSISASDEQVSGSPYDRSAVDIETQFAWSLAQLAGGSLRSVNDRQTVWHFPLLAPARAADADTARMIVQIAGTSSVRDRTDIVRHMP